jgi:nucleotide-binding universal stress UspA family protein
MKTLIVPTDFSPIATNALHYAVDMAKSINASITLIHIYQVPVSFTDTPIVLVSVDELRKSAEERVKKLKAEVEHLTSGLIKVYAETRLGNVVDEVENICSKLNPFAVVMGTKGATGLERALFGSNTLTAIKHLNWPVICVPPGKTYGNGIKKIGFACDFKNVVDTTPAKKIIEIVKVFGAELFVLNVDYENRSFNVDTPEQSVLLHTLLSEVDPSYHFIQHKDIEDGINEFAEKNNLDLIIAIPKKHKLLSALFKASSSKQLVFQSHMPVMCVHE